MSSDLQTRLTEAERSFKKACEQIVQLNRRLDEMAKRYDKASRENHRSFRYSLRLRMAVSEGVRNMYYEYAANKADEITNLRCQVLQAVGDGNQAPTGHEESEERVEEEEGNEEDSNPIADFEDVGDMDNQVLNTSGASDNGTQDDDFDDSSVPDVQGISLVRRSLPGDVSDSASQGDDFDPTLSEMDTSPLVRHTLPRDDSGLNITNEVSESGEPLPMQVDSGLDSHSYHLSAVDSDNSQPLLTSSPMPYMTS